MTVQELRELAEQEIKDHAGCNPRDECGAGLPLARAVLAALDYRAYECMSLGVDVPTAMAKATATEMREAMARAAGEDK